MKHRQLIMENPAPFVTASAWIIIDDSENNDKIRLGDVVKIKYKRSKMDKFAKVALSVIE